MTGTKRKISALHTGIYEHPDGTTFRRTPWGYWSGSDGTEVNETYIEFRLAMDADDDLDRMSA